MKLYYLRGNSETSRRADRRNIGGGGALWNSFACFHITALKWATEEKSFIDQMLALCSGFKIIIMKKLLGAPRGPHFFKKVSVPHCPTWGNVEHLGAF